jgi:hypothetical protein
VLVITHTIHDARSTQHKIVVHLLSTSSTLSEMGMFYTQYQNKIEHIMLKHNNCRIIGVTQHYTLCTPLATTPPIVSFWKKLCILTALMPYCTTDRNAHPVQVTESFQTWHWQTLTFFDHVNIRRTSLLKRTRVKFESWICVFSYKTTDTVYICFKLAGNGSCYDWWFCYGTSTTLDSAPC